MNQELSMSPHSLVAFLQKPASEFTKADIITYIQKNDIRMINFMYPAADGRLKTLNFVINNAAYLDAILTCGERCLLYTSSIFFPIIPSGLNGKLQLGLIMFKSVACSLYTNIISGTVSIVCSCAPVKIILSIIFFSGFVSILSVSI